MLTRYESLDQWRGLACLLVVLFHSTTVYFEQQAVDTSSFLGGGLPSWLIAQTLKLNVGVTLFFVISGYCIMAAAENIRRSGHSVRIFFVRRFRRIYPPMWAALGLAVLLFVMFDLRPVAGLISDPATVAPRPWWFTPSQWLGAITLTETWRFHFFGSPRAQVLSQAWTLCYEEQFYVVTGLALALWRHRIYTAFLVVSILVGSLLMINGAGWKPVDGFFFDGAWLHFAAGIGVYVWINAKSSKQRRAVECLLITGAAIATWTHLTGGGMVGFLFAAILILLHPFDRHFSQWKILAPLRVCGAMCYSLYLVHQIPMRAVTKALWLSGLRSPAQTALIVIPSSVATALALGWLFHVVVERRFLNARLPAMRRVSEETVPAAAQPA